MKQITKCILCNINLNEPFENIWYANRDIVIISTREKKGHSVRLMVMTRKHIRNPSDSIKNYAFMWLINIMQKFSSKDFVIWKGARARIPDHWHKIASCICSEGKDDALRFTEPTIEFMQTPMRVFTLWQKE